MKIDKMSVRELQALQDAVAAQIPVAKGREIEALRGKIADMAAQHGFSAKEILSPSGKTRKRAKWKDPKTGVTWAGAGRRPQNYDHSRAVQL